MGKPRGPRTDLRMTRQRQAVLEALQRSEVHPTADEVYRIVRRRLPQISLGTVYRSLDMLSESGLIRALELGGAQKRFDAKTHPHYHARCLSCGRVEDVPIEPAIAMERAARRATDYTITGHRLEFVGLCSRCTTEEKGAGKGGRQAG